MPNPQQIISTSSHPITLAVVIEGSPLTEQPEQVTVSGALNPLDNRKFLLGAAKHGSDRARLNWLLKKYYGTISNRQVRNVAELERFIL